MCGIAGFVHRNRVFSINEIDLLRMRDSLVHRGPDDGGFYSSIGVGLASRRLSIMDLSPRGHMPMRTTNGRYTIVYNGEVFNFQDLRSFLEAKGHTFESETDTEVLLKLYAEEGPHMLHRLNGMFALAIWDSFERSLFLARDRMGVKPLYYAMVDETLVFASEEKALFESGATCEFDPNSWEELLLFRYISGENTPFQGVKRLLPGHFLLWKDGKFKDRCWWDLKERILEVRQDRKVRPEDYLDILSDSVRLRLISDVPVGILLSGGLDSSSLAVLASLCGSKQLGGFTCRFREKGYDEGDIAKLVAEYWKMDFHERYVNESEILPLLEKACWINDEPLAHASNLHMLAIAQTAKPHATVLLSGDGADETLGGYERYRPLLYPSLLGASRRVIPWLAQKVPAGGRFSKLSKFLQLGEIDEFILYNTCQVLPDDLALLGFPAAGIFPYRRLVLEESKELYTHPVRRAMFSDQKIFLGSLLDRNDRMTMGTSIECRVPFLDYRLVEIAGNLPTKYLFENARGKSLLRNYVKSRLPREVFKHRKWGFGVPWHLYLRQIPELREIVADLGSLEPIRSGPFDKLRLELILTMFLQGNDAYALIVQQLFLIAVWHKICIQSRKPKARPMEIALQKKAVNQNYIVK
jgi:asparagine synthase (glutamine-hydrolysing)